MEIALTPQTQKLIEARMKRGGFSTPDELVRQALQMMAEVEAEELDDDTVAAIEEGAAQARRNEGRSWADVRQELQTKYRP